MANSVTKKDVEYQFYTRKLASAGISLPATTPVVDLAKAWQAHITNQSVVTQTASDLEWSWLGTYSGVTGATIRDRWEQAYIAVAGGKAIPSTLDEVKFMFFTLAP